MLKVIRNTLQLDLCQRVNIKRRSLIASCICSSLAYPVYVMASTLGQVQHLRIPPKNTALYSHCPPSYCCTAVNTILLSNGDNWKEVVESGGEKANKETEARLQSLLALQHWLENELPETFSRGLFDSADSSLFKSETVLEVEPSSGASSIRFRGRSKANCFLAVVRSYFAAISCERRIDLLGVHVEPKKWQIEASFRVVLFPSPSPTELNLPPEQLLQRIEQKAKWHDFRVIFYLTKSGFLSLVKITKLNPPHKRPLNITLQRMRVVSSIMPTLRGRRTLPQPLPIQCLLSPSDAANLSKSLKELDSLFGVPRTHALLSTGDVLSLITLPSTKHPPVPQYMLRTIINQSILNASVNPLLLTIFSTFSQSCV